MESYDAVVIGAGNGGLTAAATLAQGGLKTLLVERHNIPGGSATSFRRGRFEFEVALHQLSGMGRPEQPGPLRGLLGELGVLPDLEFVEMDELYSVSMPDGFRITLKAEKHLAISELQKHFPHESAAIQKFFDLVYEYSNAMVAAFIFRDPEASRAKYPLLYSHAFKPAMEVLDEIFTDPLLKTVISVYWGYLGLPPTRLSFAYLALLFFTYIEFKPYHVKGGSQAMSQAIFNKFLSSGGSARFNCGAKRILVKDGAVRGVVLDDDTEVATNYVVSNASQVATYVQMIEPGLVPQESLREMRGRSLSPSAFQMFIGFDCEHEELGLTESTNFLLANTDISDGILRRMWNLDIEDELLVVSCYNVSNPEFSPQGTCQVSAVTLKYGEPWLRLPPTQYHRVKNRVAEAMLRRIEQIYPKARAHIEEMEAATPLTHMRYLGHPNGSIYGFEHYTKDAMFFQPGRFSPVQGLLFASGWIGDAGFQPTLESGRAAANTILRKMGR
jgi:prolycopene isomerase